jgi:hypothetical protein
MRFTARGEMPASTGWGPSDTSGDPTEEPGGVDPRPLQVVLRIPPPIGSAEHLRDREEAHVADGVEED